MVASYNLSPINTTSCVSTLDHYNYDAVCKQTDSIKTESTKTLKADTYLQMSHILSYMTMPLLPEAEQQSYDQAFEHSFLKNDCKIF